MSQIEQDPFQSLPHVSFANAEFAPGSPAEVEPIGPNNPPWGLGGAFLTWASSIVLLVIVQGLFVFGYIFYRHIPLVQIADFATHDKTAILITVLALLPTHILTLMVVWAVVTRLGRFPFWSTIGWEWGRGFGFWTSSVLALILLGIGIGISQLSKEQPTQVDEMISRSLGARYVIAILATLTAPIVEEFVYRGVLYSALQRVIGARWAVAGVLLLFTMIHVPQYWPNFAVIFTIGILSFVLTAVRAYSGRILPCVVIHTVFNGIQSVFIIAEPYMQHGAKPVVNPQGLLLFAVEHFRHLIF